MGGASGRGAQHTYDATIAPGRLALSQAMMKSVGTFARGGDANDAALGVNWPTWPRVLVFDASATNTMISVP